MNNVEDAVFFSNESPMYAGVSIRKKKSDAIFDTKPCVYRVLIWMLLTNGRLSTTNRHCTPKNTQLTKKNMTTVVPPLHCPPAHLIFRVSPIAKRRAIGIDCCNMAMFFLVQLTISLFYWLFSTGGGAALSLTKGEFFKGNSRAFSWPLHRNDAH
jgi:hypothetical protein